MSGQQRSVEPWTDGTEHQCNTRREGKAKAPNDVLEDRPTTSCCGTMPEQQNDCIPSKTQTLEEKGALVVVSGRNGGEMKQRRDKGRKI